MQATRRQIMAYLANHPGVPAKTIARFLDMTPANIRYHLEILIDQGQVTVSGKRSPGGAGRPILLYHLSLPAQGSGCQALLASILDWMESAGNSDAMVQNLAAWIAARSDTGEGNRVQRFNRAVEFLNQGAYQASWEARPDGPRVSLRNCPYQDLAPSQPLLCQLDEKLLSYLFNSEMELIERRDFITDPFSPCTFQLQSGQGKKGLA